MRHNFILPLLISVMTGVSYGQNIVRNPSFESGPALCNLNDPNGNGPFYLAQNYADYWTGINPAEPGNHPVNTGNIRQNGPTCFYSQFPAGLSANNGARAIYINLEHVWDIHDSRAIGQLTTGTIKGGTYKICLAAVGFPNLPYQVPNNRNMLQVVLIKNSTGQERIISEFTIPKNTGTQSWRNYGNSFTISPTESGIYDRVQLRIKPASDIQFPAGTSYSEGAFVDNVIIGPVNSTVSPCDGTYDLAAFGNNTDIGAEPYEPGANWQVWQSNDLWNRATNGGSVSSNLIAENVDPTPGHNNLLRFRVRNRGVSTSNPSHARLYWTMGTTGGEPWPKAWDGSIAINPNGQTTPGGTPIGGEITTAYPTSNTPSAQIPMIGNGVNITIHSTYSASGFDIPPLKPGEEYIINALWDPKTPQEFGLDPAANPQICFLARIVDPNDPMYNERVTSPSYGFSDNVRSNNNIVTRNSTFVNLPGGNIFYKGTGSIFFSNYADFERNFDFRIREISGTDIPFSQYGNLIITLDDILFQKWIQSGSNAEGIEIQDWEKHELRVMDMANAKLKNISLEPGEYRSVSLSFALTQPTGIIESFHFTVTQNPTENPEEEYGTACNFIVAVNADMPDTGESFYNSDEGSSKSPASASVFGGEIILSPNPSSGTSVLEFTLNDEAILNIDLLDSFGNTVKIFSRREKFRAGRQSVMLDFPDTNPGIYRLLIHTPTERKIINLIRK